MVTGHVECGEGAVAPDEAMTFLVTAVRQYPRGPVSSRNLAFRVDAAALRPDICRVELDEIAVVLEKAVVRRPNEVSSHELARRVDSVDLSSKHAGVKRDGHVNRGEAAIFQHEPMQRVPIWLKPILSCNRVRAISVDFGSHLTWYINCCKAELGLRQSRNTQKQAKRDSSK